MNKCLLLFALLFSCIFSFAQNKKFTFKLGAEYELPKRANDLGFYGSQSEGIVNLFLKKKELNIFSFNAKTLSQSGEKEIPLDITANHNNEGVVNFENNFFWLHSDWDKSAKEESLYFDKIDVKTGTMTETNKKLFSSTKIAGEYGGGGFSMFGGFGGPGSYSGKTVGKYDLNYDANNTRLLVSYRLVPEERNDKKNYDKIGLYVFDQKMNKIWNNEFTMPYTEAIMDNLDFTVDAQGNAYMLAKVYESEKRKEKDKETGKPGYHFEVLKFNAEKKLQQYAVSLDDFFIREASLIENSVHDIVLSCTYSKKSKGTGTDGVFLAMLDQNGKVVKYKNGYYEFPVAELEKFEKARTRRKIEKKDDYEAPNLKVRNIDVEKDGSVFLALEEYHYTVSTSTYNNHTTTTYTYYYDDILGAKIDAQGNFLWLRKIPKKQRGTNSFQTLGYKMISDETGYYFLYLDNKKNVDLEEDEAPKYHENGYGGQVMVAKIDNQGNVSKELLFDTREEEVMVMPRFFKRIDGNHYIGRTSIRGPGAYRPLLISVN
ncbi:MAG: hypothetical protein ABIO04_13910 [Ferruginibacter sp.]